MSSWISRWARLPNSRSPWAAAGYRFSTPFPGLGGEIIKTFVVRDHHPFLYQSHRFVGASGKIPVAYHTMVSLPSGGKVSISAKLWAETMSTALEPDPHRGRSVLAYPARSSDPHVFPLKDGGQVDLLSYPLAETNEDLAMLIEHPKNSLGWSVVVRLAEEDMAIILKSPCHRRSFGIPTVAGFTDRGTAGTPVS
ncbi:MULTISPECIES: hypothetical protein [Rhizobium/Agrobacterium group]|uniref:Yii n=4 Tax=Agrobacterium TaxID=357 RepID=Q9JN16_AGRTU|nr:MULTISPECIES: hypothetical protein [Rhizobium/Agrobacterium group]QQN09446.1 hypothetical protein EML4058_25920 [Agrobacterium fabrum]CUX06628.1 Yii [Agrobacterium fabacearum TT111]AAF77147.1 yii [Agrobacterium tumefaciens]ASK41575.1 hypothetical protein [Agrobacterium tumefaciens]NSY99484.1 hypothetical protein [Agrobacterium tumefaciens]